MLADLNSEPAADADDAASEVAANELPERFEVSVMGLAHEELKAIVGILESSPVWAEASDRRQFLEEALYAYGRQTDILNRTLKLEGSPHATAFRAVKALDNFGPDDDGRRAICLLIEALKPNVGRSECDELDRIAGRLKCAEGDRPPQHSSRQWYGMVLIILFVSMLAVFAFFQYNGALTTPPSSVALSAPTAQTPEVPIAAPGSSPIPIVPDDTETPSPTPDVAASQTRAAQEAEQTATVINLDC